MLQELFTKPVSAAFVRRDARDGAGPGSLGPDFGEDGVGASGTQNSMHKCVTFHKTMCCELHKGKA